MLAPPSLPSENEVKASHQKEALSWPSTTETQKPLSPVVTVDFFTMMDQILSESQGSCSGLSLPSMSYPAIETTLWNSMLPSSNNAPPQTSATSTTVASTATSYPDTSSHSPPALPSNIDADSEVDDFCVDDFFNTDFMRDSCRDLPVASSSRSWTAKGDICGPPPLSLSALSSSPVSSSMRPRTTGSLSGNEVARTANGDICLPLPLSLSSPLSSVSSAMHPRSESPIIGDEGVGNFLVDRKQDEVESLLRSTSAFPQSGRESPTFLQILSGIDEAKTSADEEEAMRDYTDGSPSPRSEDSNADDEDTSPSSSPSSRKRHHGSLDSTMAQWSKVKRRRGDDKPRLPTKAKQVLADFFVEMLQRPYLNNEETIALKKKTGLTRKQIHDW